jgi:hypothetical protein
MKEAMVRLRARTDRELSILAEKQLEKTIRLAQTGRRLEAVRGYRIAQRLLAVANLPADVRRRLENQLESIEATLGIEQAASV